MCDAFTAWPVRHYNFEARTKERLTRGKRIDAVTKGKEGTVDVGSFTHAHALVCCDRCALRASQINQAHLRNAYLSTGDFGQNSTIRTVIEK
jgi:hypothetical protein